MLCPVCFLPLIAVEREQVEVDFCIQCHGLWFDRGELELLGERTGVTLELPKLFVPAEVAEAKRECPRCRRAMAKVALASNRRVVTDHCPEEHGIWFDARELGTVVDEAARAAGAQPLLVRFLGEVFGSG